MTARDWVVLLGILALLATGCGASKTDGASQPAAVFDITIINGAVMPTNAEWQATVGQRIELRVSSDAADELHIHSNPENSFPVNAEPNQTFGFTVDVPGSVDVELHTLGSTVATIQVRQ